MTRIGSRWATLAIVVLTVLRVALGILFIISSIAKLQYPEPFVDAVQQYSLLPESLAELYGSVLPWAELFIGWCLVLGIFSTFVSVLCLPLILSFIVANVYSFFHPVGEVCGCLGNLVNLNHKIALVVDIGMLCVAAMLLYQRSQASVVGIGHLLRLERFHLPKVSPLVLGAFVIAVAMLMTSFLSLMTMPSDVPDGIDDA